MFINFIKGYIYKEKSRIAAVSWHIKESRVCVNAFIYFCLKITNNGSLRRRLNYKARELSYFKTIQDQIYYAQT